MIRLRVHAALADRQPTAAITGLAMLDPSGASDGYLPERARVAMLRGDPGEAARCLGRLAEIAGEGTVIHHVRLAREWDAATMVRMWLAVPSRPPAPPRSVDPEMPALIGDSPVMRAVRERIAASAPLDPPVLLTGPTGSGKEIAARLLHHLGRPPGAPFAALNCAALTDSLAEAELFGHAAGAFTGAVADHAGLVGAAAGGVLFLDEINSLSLRLQGLLLRLLETGEYRPVGSTAILHATCRFVAATNEDLAAASAAGTFRSDLRYRLERIVIRLPSLAERRTDIPALCRHFARRATGLTDALPDAVIADLAARDWPGNVRELRSAVENALLRLPEPVPAPAVVHAPARTAPTAAAARPPVHVPGPAAARERRRGILALAADLGEIYPADAAGVTGTSARTATADLGALVGAGLLEQITRGRHGRVNPYRLRPRG